MRNRRHVVLVALSVLVEAACLPAQRDVRALTNSGASHKGAKISPNGAWVAFKTDVNGVLTLGVVGTRKGSKEAALVSSNALTGYHWAPDSSGLFFQQANTINLVRPVGGKPLEIAKIAGRNPRLLAVDPKGQILMGTRTDNSQKNSIFTIPFNGSTLPKDILTSKADYFDEIVIEPDGKRFAYTAQAIGFPHSPIDVRAADVTGANDKSLIGYRIPLPFPAGKVSMPRNLCWADKGSTLLFSAVDLTNATWQVWRVTATITTPHLMTAGPQHHRGTSVSGDLSLTVFEATTKHGYNVPGVIPTVGGARLLLVPERDWRFAGPPSIDSGGLKVVFAASPKGTTIRSEVYLVDLDREPEVAPRPALGANLTFKLPVGNGERGTLFLSTDLMPFDPKKGPTLFQIPGFEYGVAISPTLLVPLLSGVGNGTGPLTLNATVPNLTPLIGFQVFLQGMRVVSTNPDKGDFTRYLELQFLK